MQKSEGIKNGKETAELLDVSPNTISRWFDDGLFPNGYKVKKTLRIPVSDIEALKKCGVKAK